MDRTEKREFIAQLSAVFADTSFVLVAQNKGLTVADVSDLRRRMRGAGATYKVAKNRLALRALDGTRFHGVSPLLKGPTALAWSKDPVAVAKAAVEFARTNEKFEVLGGALGNRMLDASGVKALSELPSLETLRGWYQAGEPVEPRLPALSTYLGHVNVAATYWYLSCTPELQAAASARVEARWGGGCHD